MNAALRMLVRRRAGGQCEYCHYPESESILPFQLDHIIAQKHGGPTDPSNLAWVCYYCNAFKGPNISGWIEETDEIVRLFHPRSDSWNDHFAWQGSVLVLKSKVAQATISVLEINSPEAILCRRWLVIDGVRME